MADENAAAKKVRDLLYTYKIGLAMLHYYRPSVVPCGYAGRLADFPNALSRAEAADELANRSQRLSLLDVCKTTKRNLGRGCWLLQRRRSSPYSLCCAACLPCLLCGSGPARQGPKKRLADCDSRTARIDREGLIRHAQHATSCSPTRPSASAPSWSSKKCVLLTPRGMATKQTDPSPNPVPPVIYTVFPPGKPLEWSPDFAPFEMKQLFEDRERLFALQRKLDQRESVSERPPFRSHHELTPFPAD